MKKTGSYITFTLLLLVLVGCSYLDPFALNISRGESKPWSGKAEFYYPAPGNRYYTPDFTWVPLLQNGSDIVMPKGMILKNPKLQIKAGILSDVKSSGVDFTWGISLQLSGTLVIPNDGEVDSGDIILKLPNLPTLSASLNSEPKITHGDALSPTSIKVQRINVVSSGIMGGLINLVKILVSTVLFSVVAIVGIYYFLGKTIGDVIMKVIGKILTIALIIPVFPIALVAIVLKKRKPSSSETKASPEKITPNEPSVSVRSPSVPLPMKKVASENSAQKVQTTPPLKVQTAPSPSVAQTVPISPNREKYREAYALLKDKKEAEGVALLQEILREDPEYADALVLMGYATYRKNEQVGMIYMKKAAALNHPKAIEFLDKHKKD